MIQESSAQPPERHSKNLGLLRYIKQLGWSHFKARPDHSLRYKAYTFWLIKYTYKTFEVALPSQKENLPLHVRLNIEVLLSHKSWVKEETPELLNHERGHYLIGVLCAYEFRQRVYETPFFRQRHLQAEIQKIFDETLEYYVDLEKQYDQETDHFYDKDMQLVWDQYLQEQLEELQNAF